MCSCCMMVSFIYNKWIRCYCLSFSESVFPSFVVASFIRLLFAISFIIISFTVCTLEISCFLRVSPGFIVFSSPAPLPKLWLSLYIPWHCDYFSRIEYRMHTFWSYSSFLSWSSKWDVNIFCLFRCRLLNSLSLLLVY